MIKEVIMDNKNLIDELFIYYSKYNLYNRYFDMNNIDSEVVKNWFKDKHDSISTLMIILLDNQLELIKYIDTYKDKLPMNIINKLNYINSSVDFIYNEEIEKDMENISVELGDDYPSIYDKYRDLVNIIEEIIITLNNMIIMYDKTKYRDISNSYDIMKY